jgi:uncharacterized protein (TIGR03083 family)
MAQVSTAPAATRAGETEMREMAQRFATLLRSAGDGTTRVPGMRWTVGDIGAHVAQSAVHAREVLEGTRSAYADTSFNADVDETLLAAQPERNPAKLADLVETNYDALAEALSTRPDDEVLGLVSIATAASFRGILALDFMLHGTQIATALGRSFDFPAEQMRSAAAVALPAFVDDRAAAGLTATFALRFRGAAPLLYGWESGRFWVEDGKQRPIDCHVSADPRAFLLQGIGLYPVWKLALTGKMVSYGRKPWLSLKLPKLIPAVPHGGLAKN